MAGPYPHDPGFSDRLFVLVLSKLCAHGIDGFTRPHDRAQRTVCRETEPSRHWNDFLIQRGSRHATSWASPPESSRGRPFDQLKKTSRQNKGPASHSCENRLLALQHGRSVQAQ